jgi:SAM-dependent methyltransferase
MVYEPTKDYYSERLSAERLRRCYEIAPPRVVQYLVAELGHVQQAICKGDTVLELGCGYGRILPALAVKAGFVFGIDSSLESLFLARELSDGILNIWLACMNAVKMGFADNLFDKVFCVQNGISAFHVDQRKLICECIRVTKPGGIVFLSSYSERFWDYRLEWFELQSQAGLLGEIDYDKTGKGEIVCKDGFTATTVGPDEFLSLISSFDVESRIVEVDESSIFCEIVPN